MAEGFRPGQQAQPIFAPQAASAALWGTSPSDGEALHSGRAAPWVSWAQAERLPHAV